MIVEEMTVEEWKRKNPPIRRKPQTNADHIRAMSDEKLAKMMEMMTHGDCGSCEIHDYCFSQKGVECHEAWLNWLKEIYEYENNNW